MKCSCIKSGECRLAITAPPVSIAIALSSPSISSARAGSRDETGSSARMILGVCSINLAMATRCCSPPESWEVVSSILSAMPSRERASKAALRSLGENSEVNDSHRLHWPSRPASTFCTTGSCGTRSSCCGIRPTDSESWRPGWSLETGFESKNSSPASG